MLQSWLAELSTDGSLSKVVNTDETDQLRPAVRTIEWVEQEIELKAAPT